jgi:hypothetical protein
MGIAGGLWCVETRVTPSVSSSIRLRRRAFWPGGGPSCALSGRREAALSPVPSLARRRFPAPSKSSLRGRSPGGSVGRRVRARRHRSDRRPGLCAPTPAAIPIAPRQRRAIPIAALQRSVKHAGRSDSPRPMKWLHEKPRPGFRSACHVAMASARSRSSSGP